MTFDATSNVSRCPVGAIPKVPNVLHQPKGTELDLEAMASWLTHCSKVLIQASQSKKTKR